MHTLRQTLPFNRSSQKKWRLKVKTYPPLKQLVFYPHFIASIMYHNITNHARRVFSQLNNSPCILIVQISKKICYRDISQTRLTKMLHCSPKHNSSARLVLLLLVLLFSAQTWKTRQEISNCGCKQKKKIVRSAVKHLSDLAQHQGGIN